MGVEQRNCYFGIYGLNRLLIFTFACRKTEQRQDEGRRAEPAQTNCSSSSPENRTEKLELPSVSWQFPFPLITHGPGQSARALLFLQAPSFAKAERCAAIYLCSEYKTSDGFTQQPDWRTVPGDQEGNAGGISRQRSSSLLFLFHVEENVNEAKLAS